MLGYILELGLCGLEDVVKLGCKHDVAPCLEFAGHERVLAIDLKKSLN